MIFLEPPVDFRPKMHVVGCYFLSGDDILLLHRHPDKPEGGTWCVPGGKRDGLEDPRAAIRREAGEETGQELDPGRLVVCGTYYVRYPDVDFIYVLYSYRFDGRPIIVLAPKEHTDFRWVAPAKAHELPLIMDEGECIRRTFGLA